MKLIQIHTAHAFLTWPRMSVCLIENKIIFGEVGAADGEIFFCRNEHTAKMCYEHLIACLADNESFECDLPHRDAMLTECYTVAATVAPEMIALAAIQKTDCSSLEVKSYRDALLSVDPTRKYANSDGVPSYYGNIVLEFYKIQQSVK